MKTTATIILVVFLVSFVAAIYPGECSNITFPNQDPVEFELIFNSTQVGDWFNWTKNETKITYCFDTDSPTGIFTFKWFNSEEVIEDVPSENGGNAYRYGGRIKESEEPKEKPLEENKTEVLTEPEQQSKGSFFWLYGFIFLGVIILIIIIIIIKIIKRKRKQREEMILYPST